MTETRQRKTALVTGADRGIGLQLVRKFLESDHKVFAGKYLRHWPHLDALKEEFPEQLVLVEMDIASDESVRKAAQAVGEETDSLDYLVNNAAIVGKYSKSIFHEQDCEDMLKVYNVNALGPVRVTQAFLALLLRGQGRLITNISSEAGSIGTCWRYDGFGYCMSKAALNMSSALIHNSLYREHKIQVIDVHPGGVASQLGQGAYPDMPPTDERGTLSLEPSESAAYVFALILDQERFKSDHPAFVNFRGDKIPW